MSVISSWMSTNIKSFLMTWNMKFWRSLIYRESKLYGPANKDSEPKLAHALSSSVKKSQPKSPTTDLKEESTTTGKFTYVSLTK